MPINNPSASGGLSVYTSPPQIIANAATFNLVHGLGKQPVFIEIYLRCVVAANGYAVGDEVIVFNVGTDIGGVPRGIALVPNTTNIYVRLPATDTEQFTVLHKTTGVLNAVSPVNWRLYIKAGA